MPKLNDAAKQFLGSGRLAHVATIDPDGSPQVTIIWVGVDGDELVSAHMGNTRKLDNIRRDPRVTLSFESDEIEPRDPPVLHRHLVIKATARITEGGAAELLQRLAHIYIGPDVVFPGVDDPERGFIVHYTVDRLRGVGPWQD